MLKLTVFGRCPSDFLITEVSATLDKNMNLQIIIGGTTVFEKYLGGMPASLFRNL
jgi:hypothetical protein